MGVFQRRVKVVSDLCTWSDKHSPVCENIKGSVRTVPEERKSILKLVASTRRGAGITRSRSIVLTSMADTVLFDRNQTRPQLGGVTPVPFTGNANSFGSQFKRKYTYSKGKYTQILLQNSNKLSMNAGTGVRKCDTIIHVKYALCQYLQYN